MHIQIVIGSVRLGRIGPQIAKWVNDVVSSSYPCELEDKTARKAAKAARAEKKPREPNPIYPKAGTPCSEEDDELLRLLIDGIPDEELDHHIRWPHAFTLERVTFSIIIHA